MRLLFDENLSGRLVEALTDVYPGSEQILALGFGGDGDGVVWEYAKLHGLMIVTKDADFFDLSVELGAPPKVIWVRLGNCSTSDVESLLRSQHEAIRDFLKQDSETCLMLGRG